VAITGPWLYRPLGDDTAFTITIRPAREDHSFDGWSANVDHPVLVISGSDGAGRFTGRAELGLDPCIAPGSRLLATVSGSLLELESDPSERPPASWRWEAP